MNTHNPYFAISQSSTIANNTGGWRLVKPVMDKQKCNRCGLCWSYCPETAIAEDKDGFFVILYNYCKGCGICADTCPRNAITMEPEGRTDTQLKGTERQENV